MNRRRRECSVERRSTEHSLRHFLSVTLLSLVRFPAEATRSGRIIVAEQDVVHFKIPDPKNWLRGHSPIQGIRYAVDLNWNSDKLNSKKLINNAVPLGTLDSEQPIPEPERIKLGLQWQQGVGGVANAGKVPVMPCGLKFNKIQESNQEMQLTEGKEVSRDEILANYGVGPEILGKTESQTRANAETSVFIFQKCGVLPASN